MQCDPFNLQPGDLAGMDSWHRSPSGYPLHRIVHRAGLTGHPVLVGLKCESRAFLPYDSQDSVRCLMLPTPANHRALM